MFKIYSSSAGSGKTYTLTKEYLKLALQSDHDSYYRHILAVTFTNAAAQEMKERILSTLRQFSEGKEHPMILDIVRELFPETIDVPVLFTERLAFLREKSNKVFTRILHGYSDFSVMTIDSFMSRLVASFTDELGLPFGFETRLDGDLLSEAIDRLLARIGLTGDETLTALLENYYLDHAREEGAWGALPLQMQRVASDLLNEESYLAMSRVSDLSLDDWQQIRKKLSLFVKEKEDLINSIAVRALDSIRQNGLGPSDFFQSTRGIFGYFTGRSQPKSQKIWETPNSYVNKTISENKWAASKIPLSSQIAIDTISGILTNAFTEIEHIREEFSGHVTLYKSLISQLYNLSLLNEIKREFDLLLRQNNQVHISEFNRRVIDIVANDPVPFIFERLGEKYNHILIDEFQDTSKLQFANLLPLIDNALSNGFFNLIVGDVKQAIYRFRGGDMELLLKLTGGQAELIENLFGGHHPFMSDKLTLLDRNTDLARLVINRRSFREVTNFNNSFFEYVVKSENFGSALMREVYDEHFKQETGDLTPTGGHVQIEFIEKSDSESSNEREEPEVAPDNTDGPDEQGIRILSLIDELRSTRYDWRDIAILCRYKKDAARLAVWLQDARIPLISDDALLLSNSEYIGLIISFIKVIHIPDHTNQRLQTALQLYKLVLQKPLDGTVIDKIATMSKERGLATFFSWLEESDLHFDASEIYQLSIYELCEQLVARLDLGKSKTENQYLFRFLDEVLQFENTRVSHPGDFLNWWDTAGNSLSITAPAETDAIRITTIHKSKGLEFPVVILPYADWKVTPKPGSRLWIDLEAISDENLNYRGKPLLSAAVPLTKALEESPVSLQYSQEVERVLLENVNLLYVAFTRPVQRLYVLSASPVIPKDSNTQPPQVINSWLQSYLVDKGEWKQEKLSYVLFEGINSPSHTHKPVAGSVLVMETAKGNKEAPTLSLKKNADKVFYTDTFEKEKDFGQKIRQVLIQLNSRQQVEAVVKKNTHNGLFRPEESAIAISKINSLLSSPPLQDLFGTGSSRISNQILLKGGEILEADRIFRTEDGSYVLMLFTSFSPGADKKIKKLIELGSNSGLTDVKGYLLDTTSEQIYAFPSSLPG